MDSKDLPVWEARDGETCAQYLRRYLAHNYRHYRKNLTPKSNLGSHADDDLLDDAADIIPWYRAVLDWLDTLPDDYPMPHKVINAGAFRKTWSLDVEWIHDGLQYSVDISESGGYEMFEISGDVADIGRFLPPKSGTR